MWPCSLPSPLPQYEDNGLKCYDYGGWNCASRQSYLSVVELLHAWCPGSGACSQWVCNSGMPMHRCRLKESKKLPPPASPAGKCYLCYARNGNFPGCSLAGGPGAVDRCEFDFYNSYYSKW